MAEHYPRSTDWIMAECRKCGKQTAHRVDDRRKGPCLNCLERWNAEHEAAAKKPSRSQGDLFPPAA